MKYRTLGKTNLKVSEVGYGTWQFANDDDCWVGASRKESEKSLLTAIDNGLNFIDSARSYGDGLAEKWIGEIIKNRSRGDLVIASKMHPMNWQWPARKGIDIQETFPKKHILEQVESSLKDLQTDYLDLIYFHVWQDYWIKENEWKETIQNLTKQGKVKYWGISTNNYEPTNCIKACDTGLITVVQTIFNIFCQEPVQTLFPYINENNIGLVARVPLDEGGLGGNFDKDTIFEKGDFRSSYFTKERLIELEKRLIPLKKLVDESDEVESLPELALRFILSFSEVSSVIPGMRKTKHVLDNTTLSDKPRLLDNLLSELEKHSWERNFYGTNPWEE